MPADAHRPLGHLALAARIFGLLVIGAPVLFSSNVPSVRASRSSAR